MSGRSDLAVVYEPWEAWICSCGASGCHPVWEPDTRRKWHGARRVGHAITVTGRFEQLTIGARRVEP